MADVVPGTVVGTGNKIQGVAGVAITKGQWVYVDTAAGNVIKLADADALASAVVKGVALNTAAIGEEVTIQWDGVVDLGVALIDGMIYVLSQTAGAIIPVTDVGAMGAGTYPSMVGRGNSAGDLVLNIDICRDVMV